MLVNGGLNNLFLARAGGFFPMKKIDSELPADILPRSKNL